MLLSAEMQSSHKKNLCQTIKDQGGDYFFVVKDNQKTRREDIEHYFSQNQGKPWEETDAGHGRVENRKLWVLETPWNICHWVGCNHLCKIERTRYDKTRQTECIEVSYAITSLEKATATPKNLMKIWRDHWKIENQLHWVKDVEFEEDRSIVRKKNSPRFFSCMRNITVEIIGKENKSPKYMREALARFPRRSLKILKN
jgi:predicted transposase YbfD/YdcC